eukprot:TRINITY_DN8072_c0_g1_i4.p1 TRINITY_DN8072_c0_g1~~TRINITY_DN8072_c0_g1_i4.p1  ORF type:complete len:160 (+),score=33.03 TRINITY_DN8072_c0_g1_i4:599-1078(+)
MNQIEEDGATALAAGLQACPILQVLDLATNAIGPKAGKALGSFVETKMSLRRLDLSRNALGLEGFVQLEQAVDKTGGQCEVDLRFNIVVHSLYDAVCKVIQSRSISKYGIDRKVPEVDRTFYEEGVGAEEPDEIIYVEDSEQDHDLVLSPRVSESMMWT